MRTILIADDSTTIRRVVENAFAGTDVRVLAAADGNAALDVVRRERPDLLLCDVLMPGASGYDVAEAVSRDAGLAGTPVILLTGAFEPFDEARAARCGARGFLAKPFDSKTLRARVEEFLATAAAAVPPTPAPPRFADLFDALAGASAPEPPGPAAFGIAAIDDDEPLGPLSPEASPVPGAAPPPDDWSGRITLPGDEDFDLSRPAILPVTTAPQPTPDAVDAALRDECRRVVAELAPGILREIAWEVVPDLLERLLRESTSPAPQGRAAPPSPAGGDDHR